MSSSKPFTPEGIFADGLDATTVENPYTGGKAFARKGTVAATLKNIALLNELLSKSDHSEQVNTILQEVHKLIPSLIAIGVFDFFEPLEWISNNGQPGRQLVGLLYLETHRERLSDELVQGLKAMDIKAQHPRVQEALARVVGI